MTVIKALIDGDYLKYNIGFSGEKTEYTVTDKNKEVLITLSKKEVNALIKSRPDDNLRVSKRKEIQPLAFVLGRCKTKLNEVLQAVDCKEYEVFLTGTDNFRDELVDYYKKNRDPNHKPFYFDDVGEYMRRQWHATVVNGIEADDAMGLGQDSTTIICSIDKDMDTVPGWHYWDNKGLYYLEYEEAIRFFYKQLLMGDTTDNISGIKGIGKAKASDILWGLDTEEDYFHATLTAYRDRYGEEGFNLMNENGQLLWIQRQGRLNWIEEWMGAYT